MCEVDRRAEKHPRVVEGHEDHDRAPQPVDGVVAGRLGASARRTPNASVEPMPAADAAAALTTQRTVLGGERD